MTTELILIVATTIGAIISAMAGLGGGAFLLAVMHEVELAFAVPMHGAVQLIANTTRATLLRRFLVWRPLWMFMVVSAPLPWLIGMRLVDALDPAGVRIAFAIFVLATTWLPKLSATRMREPTAMGAAGVLGGALGVVFGAVGPLLAPFMGARFKPKEAAVGMQAVASGWLHIVKIAAFSTLPTGFDLGSALPLVGMLAAAAIAGTIVGRRLLGKLDERTFRWIFRAVLTLLAIKLLVRV